MKPQTVHVSHSRIAGSVTRGETDMIPNTVQGIVSKHTKPRRWGRLPVLLFFAVLLATFCVGGATNVHAGWVNITSTPGGTTDPAVPTFVPDGDPITIDASPDPGYEFSEWTGDWPTAPSTDIPLVIDLVFGRHLMFRPTSAEDHLHPDHLRFSCGCRHRDPFHPLCL